MFRGQSGSGSRSDTAKRILSSLLETSGFVCGSLKDTVQDRLADNDIDLAWVENEFEHLKTKLEKPREQILNMTETACHKTRGEPFSPDEKKQACSAGRSAGMGDSFLDLNMELDGTGTSMTVEGKTPRTPSTDPDDSTVSSDTPAKHHSRFAPVVEDARKRKKDTVEAAVARAAAGGDDVVIGLCLSRQHPTLGHPDTVTRQTAFDFNELQDRDYKYVSSTDESGWRAGGGERGDPYLSGATREFDTAGSIASSNSEDSAGAKAKSCGAGHKIASADRVHIPIIQINAASAVVIEEIISALARGEIFIPAVTVLPESLSVNATSPPDLQVAFGCEKNDDTPPEEWPNWCLEFLHNQLYEYFAPLGAQWSKRPFQITLASKVRWRTVKHMNRYFARSEQVIHSWREKGPQYLQPPHADDSSRGVILEEITRPHGIYLLQKGVPTNYFAPNFQPPYATKMRRSLIRNVIKKSWDSKHRDWMSNPVLRPRGPVQMMSSMLGCANPGPSTPLSPVHETVAACDIGAFHARSKLESVHESKDSGMSRTTARSEFELVHESKDSGMSKTTARSEFESVCESNDLGMSRIIAREESDARKRKSEKSEAPRQEEAPKHLSEENETGLDRRIQTSSPSDEYYGDSRPSGTFSSPAEETRSDAVDNIIKANPSDSNSVGREASSPNNGAHEDVERRQFFDGSSHEGTSSFESSKGVSCLESSLANSEQRERTCGCEQRQPMSLDRQKAETLEPAWTKPNPKVHEGHVDKLLRRKSKRREMQDRRQDESGERSTPTSKASSVRSSSSPVSPSCESMAYSLDSASQFRPPVAANSANDGGSVLTMGTENQSLLSYVTRSVLSKHQEDEKNNAVNEDEEADDISLSLLESKGSIALPSDSELKAVGWAKALDPRSGSYYYFTLDRKTTVWENPLVTSP